MLDNHISSNIHKIKFDFMVVFKDDSSKKRILQQYNVLNVWKYSPYIQELRNGKKTFPFFTYIKQKFSPI